MTDKPILAAQWAAMRDSFGTCLSPAQQDLMEHVFFAGAAALMGELEAATVKDGLEGFARCADAVRREVTAFVDAIPGAGKPEL